MACDIADFCKECQREHLRKKGYIYDEKTKKTIKEWPVQCKGIQKSLFDNTYFDPVSEEFQIGLYDIISDVGSESYNLLSDDDKILLQYTNNILLFAKNELGWTPYNPNRNFFQYYQKEFLMCTAKFKVGRFSRRLGKTEILVIKAIHFIYTSLEKNPTVLIFVPFDNLAIEIFNRINSLMTGKTSKLNQSKIGGFKSPFYQVSYYREDIEAEAYIRIFTTGAKSGGGAVSARGQKGHFIFGDEEGYFHPNDYSAILPLLEENPHVEFWGFSTPNAVPNAFKDKCMKDPTYKDFWYPFDVLKPIYGEEEFDKKVASYLRQLGRAKYMLEFRAEFFEEDNKVFKSQYIMDSGLEYRYSASRNIYTQDVLYFCGVDWNAWQNGVNISILSYDTITRKVRTAYKEIIDGDSYKGSSQQLQTKAVLRILELVDLFKLEGLAVDEGFGSMQCETLTAALSHKGHGDILHVVNFSGFTEIENPINPMEKIRQKNKPLLVHLMQQRLESGDFEYSVLEEGTLSVASENKKGLPYQLDSYIISKFDINGNPIFDSLGIDHYLDAVMLANYAISKVAEKLFVLDLLVSMSSTKRLRTYESIEQYLSDPSSFNKEKEIEQKFSNVKRNNIEGSIVTRKTSKGGFFSKASTKR